MRRGALLAAAVACAALAGACGQEDAERPAAPPPTLPAAAVPYLESRHRTLSADVLVRESQTPALASRLVRWGYEAGASRYFQGQSKRLQVVESRTLRFRTPEGAASFMGFIRERPATFFAGAGTTREFSSRGRDGILVEGAPCACHLATPAYLAVVARGRTVTSMEINGPRATVRALRRLVSQAP
jgi:hypothetical protein